jgi:curli biogenesis system outer membrane secretion channel CsgG
MRFSPRRHRAVFFASLALLLAAGLGLSSCASRPAPPAVPAGPLPAEQAMAKLVQDLLVTLPSPLRLGLDDFYLGTSRKTTLGRYLGQLFVTALMSQGGGAVTPIERQRLDAALAESNYNIAQLVQDPGKFAQVGNFLPAQAIASASMTILPDRVSVSLRVFSTTTGEIIGASTVSIRRDDSIESMVPLL